MTLYDLFNLLKLIKLVENIKSETVVNVLDVRFCMKDNTSVSNILGKDTNLRIPLQMLTL